MGYYHDDGKKEVGSYDSLGGVRVAFFREGRRLATDPPPPVVVAAAAGAAIPAEAGKNMPLRTAEAVPVFCWELLVSLLGWTETVLASSARKLFAGWPKIGAMGRELTGKFIEMLVNGAADDEGPPCAILYHLIQAERHWASIT